MKHGAALPTLALALALSATSARGESFARAQPFNQALVANVTATALAFMAPRTLEAVPLGQLTVWGLRGLTTIDPRLRLRASPAGLELLVAVAGVDHVLMVHAIPDERDSTGWGIAVADLARAGWDASAAVRHEGTQGVLQTFFDEMFNHLDPYSRYAAPAQAASEREQRGVEAGIGLDIGLSGDRYRVRAVVPGGPAAKAGVTVGASIAAIDGALPTEMDLALVRSLLTGPEDSAVDITFQPPHGKPRTVRLLRVAFAPDTVAVTRSGSLLLLRISGFASDTGDLLAAALARAVPTGPLRHPWHGAVLDLRGNRGGVLAQAAEVAGLLLTHGVIATTSGRDPAATHDFIASGKDLLRGLPLVVLVDGRSASAAEVVAAALADQHRAVLVGSVTFGKGLVQTITPLPDGGELLLSWSQVLAPLGWPLQGLGVLPQVCTSLGQIAAMRQLKELAHGVQPMARALSRHRAARTPMLAAEMLEIRNTCPAAEGRDDDLADARILIEDPVAYDSALLGPAGP